MRRLMQISAFYKNDSPKGLGLTLTEDAGDLNRIISVLQEHWDLMWRESVANSESGQLVNDLRGQLNALSGSKDELSFEQGLLVIGNVYLLEKTGSLKPDEYNGLQLVYCEHPIP
jgi:hypothetical protein